MGIGENERKSAHVRIFDQVCPTEFEMETRKYLKLINSLHDWNRYGVYRNPANDLIKVRF